MVSESFIMKMVGHMKDLGEMDKFKVLENFIINQDN